MLSTSVNVVETPGRKYCHLMLAFLHLTSSMRHLESDIILLENSHVQTPYGTEPNGFMRGYGGDSSTVGAGFIPALTIAAKSKKQTRP